MAKHKKNKFFNLKDKSVLFKIIFSTIITLTIVTVITQTFLYNYVEDVVYNMELEKMENAHTTVYDTFTSASLTNEKAHEVIDANNVSIAQGIARLLGTSEYNVEDINQLAKEMNVEDVHIINDNGIVDYSTNYDFVGFNLNNDEAYSERLNAINGETIIEDAPYIGRELIQYISVPRVDEAGMIVVEFSSEPHLELFEMSSPQYSIGQTSIGETGLVMAFNADGDIKVHTDDSLLRTFIQNEDFLREVIVNQSGRINFTENDREYFGIYERRQGLYIVAALGVEEVSERIWQVQRLSLLFAVISLLLMVLAVYAVYKKFISKRIKTLLKEFKLVSQGDLTRSIPVKSKDEMGDIFDSFNHTMCNMRNLIGDVYKYADIVTSNSEELTASSQQISTISQEIANVIEDIATSAVDQAEDVKNGSNKSDELEKRTQVLSELSYKLTDLSKKMEGLKDKGLQNNELLIEKTKSSNESVESVFNMVRETNESAKKIGDIINVIDAIASQTSLLALNASIESARAGEAGKGFAVVSEEIKQLAEQSAQSAQDIQELIKELQNKSTKTVETMNGVKELIEAQSITIEGNKDIFSDLANEIEVSRESIKDLDQLESQIIANKTEIVDVLHKLARIAEDNASSTEEVSATTEEQTSSIEEVANSSNNLSDLAVKLKAIINQFKI
ncbi:methyl-accepting chemotaxis protein [Natranaerovirga hydrolytica]|uniref:Methyl-accepting chemotaxis protein n=1 Tax=Natranaerovirga hydrolytica TaxID=680378 RepID=A0A4R1MDB8_9FIRM|nr:methyl-accepting chemotaxis protein [Natranaerovirga hydrolytica]TCK90508.1 methyl-accepting chemotaxis protein [Natranaerovirga hydrolytica]